MSGSLSLMPFVPQPREHKASLQAVLSCESRADAAEGVHNHPSLQHSEQQVLQRHTDLNQEQLSNCLGLWGYKLFRLSITFH